MSPPILFVLLLLYVPLNNLSLISATTSTRFHVLPRLSPTGPRTLEHENSLMSESISQHMDLETYFYNQTLDHFNFQPQSFNTFQQRYLINSKFWGGRNSSKNNNNSPIFVYLGAESSIDNDLPVIGFLADNAARFNALTVFIEVR